MLDWWRVGTEDGSGPDKIKEMFALTASDFEVAKNEVRKSVSDTEVKRYEQAQERVGTNLSVRMTVGVVLLITPGALYI